MNINAVILGATGMVGEGVLHVSLNNPNVESVLVIGRKSCGVQHPKLKELIHTDFFDLSCIENPLKGFNACYFCLGVSSLGMNEHDYTRTTYELTMHVAATLVRLNPEMTFCYVSGEGTDSSEHGRTMWARVKGKTENDLKQLPFKSVYNFRPPFMLPTKGLKNVLPYYKYVTWLYPISRPLFPSYFITLRELGLAMINCALIGYDKKVLEAMDVVEVAKRTAT
ncbi:MAG: NAD-dependent epimerase/dehydratase family protein [Bacteroidota bacterium]